MFQKKIRFCEIFEKLRIWSKFPINLIFSKISLNFRLWSNFRKISILDFSQILGKISILVKFLEKFDFGQCFKKKFDFVSKKIFNKFDFFENFLKFSTLVKFRKISILVKISSQIFRFWSNFSKNFDFGQIFKKISNLVKFSKIESFVKNFELI